jgi:predicted nucleic acid-binding Zn ribbon protein
VGGVAIEPLPQDRDTLHSLSSSLGRLQRSLGLARPDTLRILEDAWPQLVGTRLAAVCRVHSLRDGRLTVAVDDPAVADALRWQLVDLAAAANQLCGCDAVEKVEIRVDPRG